MESDSYCTDCSRITNPVFDHSTGDLICSDCGLVLDSRCIDETCEWRTFSNSDSISGDHDPNRVGHATDMFRDSDLVTFTSKQSKRTTASDDNSGLDGVGPSAYRIMSKQKGINSTKASVQISYMCDRLGLVESVESMAKHLYSVQYQKVPSCFRGKHHDAFLGACVYMVCTQEGVPRTVKEISLVANGTPVKEILRAKGFLTNKQDEDNNNNNNTVHDEKMVRAGDLVKRFCTKLGMMNHRVTKAVQEAVDNVEGKTDVRRNPASVAATIVYMMRQLCDEDGNDDNNEVVMKKRRKRSSDVEQVVNATGVGKNTIVKTYKEMYPHLLKIVPTWFAQPYQIARLHCPQPSYNMSCF